MSRTVGIFLSGCGVYDGSEIQEAVFATLFLDRAGAKIVYIAPDMPQMHVVNHMLGQESKGETRNALVEAARIARGNIRSAKTVQAQELDALVFPGGYGAAKNLCDFATKGAECSVDSRVERIVREMLAAGKPMGFICVAPALCARIVGDGVRLTIGNDADTASALEKMGAKHVACSVDQIAVDEAKRIVSVPAYMYGDASPSAVAAGIEKLVAKVLELA